jgi:hypothetical protein
VSAGEREAWAGGNALSARNVSFASLPVSQRAQKDCSRISSNPARTDVAIMFMQLMASQQGINASVTKVEASQQGIFASVTEVKQSMTEV